MKKPSAFNWKDLFTFGAVALWFTAVALYVTIAPSPDKSPTALVLFWVVAAAGWGVYAMLVRARAALLRRFGLVTEDGLLIDLGGYAATSGAIRAETLHSIARMRHLSVFAGKDPAEVLKRQWVWVRFAPGPLDHPIDHNAPKLMGFVRAGGSAALVAYIGTEQPVSETAFGHELEHIMLGRATGDWDQERHHQLMGQATAIRDADYN